MQREQIKWIVPRPLSDWEESNILPWEALQLSDEHDRITASLLMLLNHSCTYTHLCYFRKSERKTLLLLQLSFALFRLLISFVLSSIYTHGTEDTAAMKSVQDETPETVSDFASWTLTYQETSQRTERDIDLQKNVLNKGFYKTKSESLPLGVLYHADD